MQLNLKGKEGGGGMTRQENKIKQGFTRGRLTVTRNKEAELEDRPVLFTEPFKIKSLFPTITLKLSFMYYNLSSGYTIRQY